MRVSFFTLSLIKTYLRSTMGDDSLIDLMMMLNEKALVKSLDFDAILMV